MKFQRLISENTPRCAATTSSVESSSPALGGDCFPSASLSLTTRVRINAARLLTEGKCTHRCVAFSLGLHPRTLQRKLRKEGESFESIKDSVRRDVALRYLQQKHVPLLRVAEILGYSEASVLSRSCHRWFAASPRELRKRPSFG